MRVIFLKLNKINNNYNKIAYSLVYKALKTK